MGDNVLAGLLPGGSVSLFRFSEPRFDEKWSKLELITAILIQGIQPSRKSEVKRRAICNYVERLIANHFKCQVSTYGSVPLKTYLPDGDIDLSTFTWLPHSSEIWANELHHLLKHEEHNKHAVFCVREVQIINAEVQIVKCLVDNVTVDISFNQLGGLCTLCFLEEVDRLVGRNHLFKRSIILVKAWCYYESRILGAHHGLISTYALETLVLYIFNIFHASLRGPFEVLYKFLQFFSQFDWKHYCLSLWGPIHITTLQKMSVWSAEPLNKDGNGLLFSHDFLSRCSHVYGVAFIGAQDIEGKNFSSKNMNVVDPIRSDNNLGRSVNIGNFFRICSAFAYGAKQIEKLFQRSLKDVSENLDEFFINTSKHCNPRHPNAFGSNLTDTPVLSTLRLPKSSEGSCAEVANQRTENPSALRGRAEGRFARADSSTSIELANKINSPVAKDTMSQLKAESISHGSKTGNDCSSEQFSKLKVLETATTKNKSRYKNVNGVFKKSSSCLPDTVDVNFCSTAYHENARDLSSAVGGCNGVSYQADCSEVLAPGNVEPIVRSRSKMADGLSVLTNKLPDSHILAGDLDTYMMTLHACRWMVACQVYAPVTLVQSMINTGWQIIEPHACEGPGRPSKGNKDPLTQQALTHKYKQSSNPCLQAWSLQRSPAMPSNSTFQKDSRKSQGIGSHLPGLQTGKFRSTLPMHEGRGMLNAVWNETANFEEVITFASKQTYSREKTENSFSVGAQSEKELSCEQNRQENGHSTQKGKLPRFSAPSWVQPAENSVSCTAHDAILVDDHRGGPAGDTLTSNLRVTVLGPFANSCENSPLSESLEFGSLGPGFLSKSKMVLAHDIWRKDQGGWKSQSSAAMKVRNMRELGEETAKKMLLNEKQQSSANGLYALSEQDFPPLLSVGQTGQTTNLSSQKGAMTVMPHLQGIATDSLAWNTLKLPKNVNR